MGDWCRSVWDSILSDHCKDIIFHNIKLMVDVIKVILECLGQDGISTIFTNNELVVGINANIELFESGRALE